MSVDAIDIIRNALKDGRSVVPFVGAGLSAAAGFPLINEIRDYLCKVRFLIEGGVYRHLLGEELSRQQAADSPQFNPSRYIDFFGWPDLNQLNADLWWFFINEHKRVLNHAGPPSSTGDHGSMLHRFRRKELNEGFRLFQASLGAKQKEPWEFRWGEDRWCLQSAALHVTLEDLEFHDTNLALKAMDAIWLQSLKPRIDWFRYLLDLAGGRRGLVDALFSQMGYLRKPSLGHVMLAQLASEFGWRLHLTINFDTLLETAFRNERLNPSVFEVSRETTSPDPVLVRRADLSLIKLHGGSFDLRIGEPIDHSLDESTRSHVFGCVPDDALLLVIGFSGYERRMMQLIEELVLARQLESQADVRVLWMHWEESPPATVESLKIKLSEMGRDSEFMGARLSDSGLFLLDVYQALSTTLPSTLQSYQTLPKRILTTPPSTGSIGTKVDPGKRPLTYKYTLFAEQSLKDRNADAAATLLHVLEYNAPASEMSAFVRSLPEYHPIWIDLEEHHTVSGIVGEIIQRMRAFDPHLPELVLPIDDDPASLVVTRSSDSVEDRKFDKSLRYIRRAMRRGRYILAFDALEGFGREQTSHHGLPSDVMSSTDLHVNSQTRNIKPDRQSRLLKRHVDLLSFLEGLVRDAETFPNNFSDWYLCVAVGEPTYRHMPFAENSKDFIKRTVRHKIIDFCEHFAKFAGTHVQYLKPLKKSHADPPSSIAAIQSFWDHIGNPNNPNRLSQYHGWSDADDLLHTAIELLFAPSTKSLNEDATNVPNGVIDIWRSPQSDMRLPHREKSILLTAYLILSVFRRPRSRAAVYSVLTDLLPLDARRKSQQNSGESPSSNTECVDKVLRQLQEENLIRPMDGGFYWIPNLQHQWTYKLLTESIRRQCTQENKLRHWLKKDWTEVNTDDYPRAAKRFSRLLAIILMHSRIARFYYMHVFRRSGDISGLHEYMYHRMSAIKYLSTARSLAVIYLRNVPANFKPCLTHMHERIEAICRRDGVGMSKAASREAGIVSSNNPEIAGSAEMLHLINLLQQNYLQRLLNVFTREAGVILSRGTADTWLSWIEMLNNDFSVIERASKGDPDDFHYGFERNVLPILRTTRARLCKIEMQLLREKGARKRHVDRLFQEMFMICDSAADQLSRLLLTSGRLKPDGREAITEVISRWNAFKSSVLETAGGEFPPASAIQPRKIMQRFSQLLEDVFCSNVFLESVISSVDDVVNAMIELPTVLSYYLECCASLRHYAGIEPTREWITALEHAVQNLRAVLAKYRGGQRWP